VLFLGVKQACSEFLEKQLDPSNCLGIRIFAENHGCESLRQAAEQFTFKYFEDVTGLEEFCTLGLKDVELLLKSDEIQVGCFSLVALRYVSYRIISQVAGNTLNVTNALLFGQVCSVIIGF